MSEFYPCVRHGRRAVLTGPATFPQPLRLSRYIGCSIDTAEALVGQACAVALSCGCPFVRDVDTAHALISAEAGA